MGKPAELHPMGPHYHSNEPVNRLLDRLERVEKNGTGVWRARCPAHDGKSNSSLAIAIGDDGRILLHDFGGCDALEVVNACGLEMSDLFPERITHKATKQQRRELRQLAKQAQWKAALPVVHRECLVVIVAAGKMLSGEMLAQADNNRLAEAIERIESAKAVLCGR